MMKNFTFWRLPAGVILWFQRHRHDGLTSWTFYTAGRAPFELSVSAAVWTRDAYYGPAEQRRFGDLRRTLYSMWCGTGFVMSSYCASQRPVWGGIALALPRLNLSLGWHSRAWMQKAGQHGWPEPCQDCADAGRMQRAMVNEIRGSSRQRET
ncbi:hypothetical protein [Streptomyces hirsutus]|uniref:hypothetical protein n=1 Tax=Streptomyces hirsutus TaxID=35620 RepID=UPI0033316276